MEGSYTCNQKFIYAIIMTQYTISLIPLIIFENSIIAFTIEVSIQETYECGKFEILFISVVWKHNLQPRAGAFPYPTVSAVKSTIGCEVVRERIVGGHLSVRNRFLRIVNSKRIRVAPLWEEYRDLQWLYGINRTCFIVKICKKRLYMRLTQFTAFSAIV